MLLPARRGAIQYIPERGAHGVLESALILGEQGLDYVYSGISHLRRANSWRNHIELWLVAAQLFRGFSTRSAPRSDPST